MIKNIEMSLEQILGEEYCKSVARASAFFNIIDKESAAKIVSEKVSFTSKEHLDNLHALLKEIGNEVVAEFKNNNFGASTNSFGSALQKKMAPIGGLGYFRIGENGKIYLLGKSEHYHCSLGHNFNGYKLVENAKRLGIVNATHNNTRGYITRLLEKELIRTINGIEKNDDKNLNFVLDSKGNKVLNRVINLQTGSLAVEAGVKMMLARFYRLHLCNPEPKYGGKVPVFFVIADNEMGTQANYHGTTLITQVMRGMWPDFYEKIENDAFKVVGIKINDINDFETKIKEYNTGKYKTAGFLHEIILMNYGGIKLKEDFLKEAYRLCEKHDTMTLVDEIQSCMWYKGMYLFRSYGIKPDFVILGKGFPGGEYPASKIITTSLADNLDLFGALVTNGQEELASLSYLVTMEFAAANEDHIESVGRYLEEQLFEFKQANQSKIMDIEGKGHLASIHFKTMGEAEEFAKRMNKMCIDISVQTYKRHCPPAVLIKPPIIIDQEFIDVLVNKMNVAIKQMGV